jgi:hypothetical protein
MASLDGFNANEVEPNTEFEPLPTGKYTAILVESAYKPTKAGTGHYLELKFQIVTGQYQGRHVWARLNLDNPNELAVKIAKAELSALCRAVGVMTPKDSIELHNLPLELSVKVVKQKETGDLSNEIKGYSPRTTAAAAPAAVTASSPPWKK